MGVSIVFTADVMRPDLKGGELSRLDPEKHIDMSMGIIRITPAVAKTNEKRRVFIQPNLKLWMQKYPIEDYPIFPKDVGFKYQLEKLRRKFKIPHDGLRHTYISMMVGSFRSIADVALQSGNSESVIRKHYLDLKSVEEADAFWRVVPKGTTLPKLKRIRGEARFILEKESSQHMDII